MPGIIIGIYTHKCQVLLLEYAVLPGTLGHGCFSLNIFFLFLFFFFIMETYLRTINTTTPI